MTIQPTGDNVVLKIEKQENKTQSGIILAVTPQNNIKADRGIVVATGKGRRLNNGEFLEPVVKVGDNVIFSKFAGVEIESGEELYIMIKENDILAIIND